ncbi:MAG: M15 family metallopeptidase [Treponema sp.]|nr:M15 family metallopeptidase [Treponema sp.]
MSKKNPLGFFLVAFFLVGCGSVQTSAQDDWRPVPSTALIEGDLEAQHKILLALAQGYPDIITDVEFINNDWTMMVNGVLFYYANGRFLPERLRNQWRNYLPYDFYTYPFTGTDEHRRIFLDNPVYSVGSSFLFDTIYGAHSEDEAWELQEKYSLFGVKILVHPLVVPILDRISDQVRVAARQDRTINPWIAELHTSTPHFGWNWRPIAGTNRRSNHSYGIAVDLLPRDLRGRLTYWRYEDENDGRNVPINRRTYYMPPDTVIKIFEEHGFIWGGNWALIDTMHFEYRPEILILNGFTLK